MNQRQAREPGDARTAILFGASLIGLCAVLLLDFGVIYTISLSPEEAQRFMKIAFVATAAGILLAGFQGVLVLKGILPRLGEDRRRADDMERRINSLTVIDSQTRTYNRRKFDTVIIRELENTRRYGSLLCGIFFDIDNFKDVNENRGYAEGDTLLRTLARFVKTRLRETDYLFRWRGGKFLILMVHTDIDKAAVASEKFRKAVETTRFLDETPVTVSVATTQARAEDTPQEFIQRLQGALAAAKSKGRNRTEVAR